MKRFIGKFSKSFNRQKTQKIQEEKERRRGVRKNPYNRLHK